MGSEIIKRMREHLARLGVEGVAVEMDERFEPDAGPLVKLELGGAYWHLLPAELLEILEQLPDGAGAESIKTAIQEKATTLWSGPEPRSYDQGP